MINFLINKLRKCQLQTQVIIFQLLVIIIFVVIWGSILILFLQYYQQIFNGTLFRSLVAQIYSSTVNQVFNGFKDITNYQLLSSKQKYFSTLELFSFMMNYQMQIHAKIERCLQSQYNNSFYSLQFCYGVYENQSMDNQMVNKFVGLETIILPIFFQQPLYNIAIISADTNIYVAQYVGGYQPLINKTITQTIDLTRGSESKLLYQSDGVNQYSIFVIPITNITFMAKINASKLAFGDLLNDKFIYNVSSYLIQTDGKIILGNSLKNRLGTIYFNDTEITGFNQSSLDLIVNFLINKTNPISNTCQDLINMKLFCLVDANNHEKMIAGRLLKNNQIALFVLDSKKVYQVREDLELQFKFFFYESAKLWSYLLGLSLFLTLLIEFYLLSKLNHQIKTLQNVIHDQIRGNFKLKNFKIFKNPQSQIQLLGDAYQKLFDLKTNGVNIIVKQLNKYKYSSEENCQISQYDTQLISAQIQDMIRDNQMILG